MIWFHVVLSIVLFSGLSADDSSNSSNKEIQDVALEIRKFIENRCNKNAHDYDYEQLLAAARSFKTCISNDMPYIRSQEDLVDAICKKMPSIWYGCLKNVVDKLEECLNSEERYLTNFALDTFNASLEQQCKDDGKHVLDRLSAIRNGGCNVIGATELSWIVSKKCFTELKPVDAEGSDFIIDKSLLCSYLKTSKECAVEAVKEQCDDDGVSKFAESSFEPYLDWCTKASENEVESD